jgi:hypothetical protein
MTAFSSINSRAKRLPIKTRYIPLQSIRPKLPKNNKRLQSKRKERFSLWTQKAIFTWLRRGIKGYSRMMTMGLRLATEMKRCATVGSTVKKLMPKTVLGKPMTTRSQTAALQTAGLPKELISLLIRDRGLIIKMATLKLTLLSNHLRSVKRKSLHHSADL